MCYAGNSVLHSKFVILASPLEPQETSWVAPPEVEAVRRQAAEAAAAAAEEERARQAAKLALMREQQAAQEAYRRGQGALAAQLAGGGGGGGGMQHPGAQRLWLARCNCALCIVKLGPVLMPSGA